MDLGKAIRSILVSATAVNDEVTGRIFPDKVPQETPFPLIAYTLVSTEPTLIKAQVSPNDVISVQVDIYSKSYETTQTLDGAVRTALDQFKGTQNGVVIENIVFRNTGAGRYDEVLDVYWVSQDYDIRINRV